MTEMTLEDIAMIAGVGAIFIGGGIFTAATVGYSIMTSISGYLSRKVKESDNMGILDYFRQGKREITELKKRFMIGLIWITMKKTVILFLMIELLLRSQMDIIQIKNL